MCFVHCLASASWCKPPPPFGFGHTQTRATHTQLWLRPPPGQAPKDHSPSDCRMNCTHGAQIMVCRITLRVIICAMSCALEAHMFVLRRTPKHNQPPHMGLSSAAPCQAAWPFSVTLRRSSVHRKAKSWAKRRCAQETTPPPSASHTHERTSSPLFRQKTSFLFLRTTLAHLPAPVDYVRPTQTHKPTRPSNKPKIDPTPGNPQTSGVTKLRPRMTPHSRSNHTYARTHERTSNPLSRRFLETPSRPVFSTAVTTPTGIRPRHKIFSQSTISPTTKKLHQTNTETGYGARPTDQHTRT